jgi:hypothetical protein
MPQIESGAHLVTEHSMDSESSFSALEVMCRERARLADKESNYWLAKAEEWARLRLSCHKRGAPRASSGGHSSLTKAPSSEWPALILTWRVLLNLGSTVLAKSNEPGD